MAQLKLQKEKYTEELKEVVKKSRKGSELATVESQIKGLENRLKYSQKDLDTSKKSISDYDRKLAELEDELNAVGVRKHIVYKIGSLKKKFSTVLAAYWTSWT